MLSKTFLLALAAIPMALAHGRVDVVKGDAGGNGTALAIQGGNVPLTGSNKHTEVDTTVFGSRKIASNGLGKTKGSGKVSTSMIKQAMALSGDTLPQVKSTLSGTWHVVTSDGFGPVKAVLTEDGSSDFSKGVALKTTKDVIGRNGNEPKGFQETNASDKDPKKQKNSKSKSSGRSVLRRMAESAGVIQKRAHNINADFPMEFEVPAGTKCTGTMGGQSNVCLVKIANENGAGPFGGVVAIQMASDGDSSSSSSSSSSNGTVTARSFRA